MSERENRPTAGGNPFIPDDLGTMTLARRRAYAARLLLARDKLVELTRISSEGLDLRALVVELDAALGVLRGKNGPSQDDAEGSGRARAGTDLAE